MVYIKEEVKGDKVYYNVKLSDMAKKQPEEFEKIFDDGLLFTSKYGISYLVQLGHQDKVVSTFLSPYQYVEYLKMPLGKFTITKDEEEGRGIIVDPNTGAKKIGKRNKVTYVWETLTGQPLNHVETSDVEGYARKTSGPAGSKPVNEPVSKPVSTPQVKTVQEPVQAKDLSSVPQSNLDAAFNYAKTKEDKTEQITLVGLKVSLAEVETEHNKRTTSSEPATKTF